MADDATKQQSLEGLLRKLEDIANSQAALVEKLATAQTQAEEAGLAEIGVGHMAEQTNAVHRGPPSAHNVRSLQGGGDAPRSNSPRGSVDAVMGRPSVHSGDSTFRRSCQ